MNAHKSEVQVAKKYLTEVNIIKRMTTIALESHKNNTRYRIKNYTGRIKIFVAIRVVAK